MSESNRGVNLSPAKRVAKGSQKPFIPGHRKSKSEGGNIIFGNLNCVGLNSPLAGLSSKTMNSMDSLDNEKVSLLDGSLLDPPSPPRLPAISPPFAANSDKVVGYLVIAISEETKQL